MRATFWHRACRRLAPGAPGKGGRRIEKSGAPNPVAQNRRQVAIVRAALQSAGAACPVWGPFIFSNPYARVHAHAPELVQGADAGGWLYPLRRAVCGPARLRLQPAARGRCRPAGAGRTAKHAQPGQSTKGISACFFLRRRAARPPVAPLKNKALWRPCLATMGLCVYGPFLRHEAPPPNSSLRNQESLTKKGACIHIMCQ